MSQAQQRICSTAMLKLKRIKNNGNQYDPRMAEKLSYDNKVAEIVEIRRL